MRTLISFFLFLSISIALAQGNQSSYLEAKRLYSQGNYRDAMGAFQSMTNDPVFGSYASFYYALSAYHQELPQVALDMWKQVLVKYPNWDQRKEVEYWLAKTSLERKRYLEGLRFVEALPEDQKTKLLSEIELDNEELKDLFQANSSNEQLAKIYFKAIMDQPTEERDIEALLGLASQFGFDPNIVSDFPMVKKDTYAVALVLPFMFDSLENPQSVIRNRIIFELYQGMTLAQDSLKELGIALELFPYDTKKMGSHALNIVKNESLMEADVIVGPLYAEPTDVVSKFARENEIPMLNPLSSNGSVVDGNEYAYLFKPSYKTQGREAGKFAVKKYTNNKNAMVLFETERDQFVAENYKEIIEADSFNVVLFDELTKELALQLQKDFTDEYEVLLDSISQEEIDSIALIPGRVVRSRPRKNDETGRILKDGSGEDRLDYYEMVYKYPMDTIGHIFVASSSNLLANNVISIANLRRDTIAILGYDDWLKFKLVSFNQLERLNISLINTSHFKEDAVETVTEKFVNQHATEPSEFHLMGFEIIMQLGNLFDEYGKYFQRGLISNSHIDGYLMEGLRYGAYRDNQVVPIVTIEDLRLKIENSEANED